jgi:hypothetical protein
LVERGRLTESAVVAEHPSVGVEDLEAVDRGEADVVHREVPGTADVRRDGGRRAMETGVEVAVEGVLDPPVHEGRGAREEHEHGGHEPGDQSSPERDAGDPSLEPAHGCPEVVGRAGSSR